MKVLLNQESRIENCLKVEAALARAQAEIGTIPKGTAKEITKKASLKYVKITRVNQIDNNIKHDLMAIVKALAEKCDGDAGKYVHLGATSYDIIDTAMALEIKNALDLILDGLYELMDVLSRLSMEYKEQVMVGRTHGQFGLPITLGLKFSVFTQEVMRHIDRVQEAYKRVTVGKLAGAVGASAGFGPKVGQIRKKMSKDLGIDFEEATTQIVQRDRYVELISILANICTSMERFATEIRNLQRSEISEVSEGFDIKKQVGSSTMAHKQNPIMCENISGLSRTMRGFMLPTWENAIQWHERDLANSSSERFTIPHSLILTDDVIFKMTGVFQNLVVHPSSMESNLNRSRGLIMAEKVLLELTDRGIMGRQEAHEFLRKASMEARTEDLHLLTVLKNKKVIKENYSEKELEAMFDPAKYLGDSKHVVNKTAKKAQEKLKNRPKRK